jgi:predicted O-linked N-acetylglucosamine transferase (SPINDLY family)
MNGTPPVPIDHARSLLQQGLVADASVLCRELLTREPGNCDLLALMAEIAAKQGDPGRAIELYDQLLNLQPQHAVGHYKRSNLLKDSNRLDEALAGYDRAIALNPGYAYALCNRGVVLQRLDRWGAALESYDRAIQLDPKDAIAHYNRGIVLRMLEKREEALASYAAALAINPNYAECLFNQGILQSELKRWDAAMVSLDRAILLRPDFAAAYFHRGGVFASLRQDENAIADFDRTLALDPTHADACESRAYAYVRMRRYAEAVASCDHAFALKPDCAFLAGIRQNAKMNLCDWRDLDADLRDLARGVVGGSKVSSPFWLLSLLDAPALHRMAARTWVGDRFPANRSLAAIESRPAADKIRIGYFSADFYDHVVGVVMAQIFEMHDRSKYELTAFSYGPDTQDPVRKRLEKAFDRFIDVRGLPDREIALLARSLCIDVAVDLGGHSQVLSHGTFAFRAAPLQVNYLGYPGTSGADYMDYLIADRTVIPRSAQAQYSEKVVYLPDSYLPYDSTRVIADRAFRRDELGLPPTGFVFCCFNSSYKIMPLAFDSWLRILARVDQSVLWLSRGHATAMDNLRREAARRGIDPQRLVFADRVPSAAEHLARYRVADLFLDTLPYNAHATAMDALWAGLPVLTRIGEAFAGRVAASLLKAIGLPELIAESGAQYEDLAVELANNPRLLLEIRGKLDRNRDTAPLFDSATYTRGLEQAYDSMLARHRAGLPPAHIDSAGPLPGAQDHAGHEPRRPPKTLLFCTTYADTPDRWSTRYRKWWEFFSHSKLARDQILMIDDGSPSLPSWQDVELLTDLPERQPSQDGVLYHFENTLGRSGIFVYPGWFRSFAFAAVYAQRYGFDKVVHVESDCFLYSNQVIDFIDGLSSGWTALWCPRWDLPETCIQVICADQLEAYRRLSTVIYAETMVNQAAETLLPFTDFCKDFVGDRYGEYALAVPEDADYACQIPDHWPA